MINLRKTLRKPNHHRRALLLLLRPKHWLKNSFLFAGLLFSASFLEPGPVYFSLVAFVSFCLLSSSAYIINDILDVAVDKKHPKKKNRPLAAGIVTKNQAALLVAPLLATAFALAWYINLAFFLCSLAYFLLTLSYSIWLKHIVIIDILVIACGFLLRATAGAFAIEVAISPWFLLCTLLLSLFLALTKRRQELLHVPGAKQGNFRKVLAHYPLANLDRLISLTAVATLAAYSLYTFSAGPSRWFILTIPLVAYGIFRYLYLLHKKGLGENPEEVLLADRPLFINVLVWIALSILILTLENL